MPQAPDYTQADLVELQRLFNLGYSNSRIGEALGRSHNSVARKLSEMGITSHRIEYRRDFSGIGPAIEEPDYAPKSRGDLWEVRWTAAYGFDEYQDDPRAEHEKTRNFPPLSSRPATRTLAGIPAY